ncbi:hypothetical protein OG739_32425 [Streptomyces longwoodensis]|uniref:hypothetical protein n=1 Tax=Streptomyces longwoodensis TaxID=68231 RepID=UPI00224CD6E9|nr:hypothetical protein [Streptomyces longwoodensis]MCX4997406.1 hypothetical protein [Streptomyces longwoodensis]WRY92034.1 hypothetical protein OG481_27570 [Streptomyces longwoodensis]WTI43686.1 hypothetical protein OG547_03795 [Streptomyces longwoodensis]WUC56445.1 hypothetical protein OHA09_04765 [Streptomyces longwoodensis]WUC69977.1 hypothetical protein OG416_03760 [Streptomyces longwoodensis]
MVDHRLEGPGENGTPVPRDLPDQQADTGEDPWEGSPARAQEQAERTTSGQPTGDDDETGTDTSVPDTDEAGTGRQGAPTAATAHSDHPTPDEPAD